MVSDAKPKIQLKLTIAVHVIRAVYCLHHSRALHLSSSKLYVQKLNHKSLPSSGDVVAQHFYDCWHIKTGLRTKAMPSCGPKPANRARRNFFFVQFFWFLCVRRAHSVLQVNGCCRLTVTQAHAGEQVHKWYAVQMGFLSSASASLGHVGLRIRQSGPHFLFLFVKTLTHFIRDVCVYYPLWIAGRAHKKSQRHT